MTIYRINHNLRIVLSPFHWSGGKSAWSSPGASPVIRALDEQVEITPRAGLSTSHIVMFVQSIDMAETIGSNRRLPVITRVKANSRLLAKLQPIVRVNCRSLCENRAT